MKVSVIVRRYKNYVRDFGLSIISSMVLTIVTSLILNPLLASHYGEEVYGKILTLCGLATVFSSAFGNSLNNVRLIKKNENIDGFNFLVLTVSVLSGILVALLSVLLYAEGIIMSCFLSLHVFFSTMNMYYMVTYRLEINYYKNLFYNIITAVGYLVGIAVCIRGSLWALIYVIADVFGFIFLRKTSFLFEETYTGTKHVISILKNYVPLVVTSFLGQVLLYLDRFIVYPLLGSASVAVYSTASFFGKSIGLVMAPIASVLLSYYADAKKTMKRSSFWEINALVFVISLVFCLISVVFAPFLTKLIYPTIYGNAKPFLFVANLAAIINIMGTMTNPFLLKFCDVKWQVYITCIYGVFSFVLGVIGGRLFGLWGFAISSILANGIRLVIMYLVGHVSLKAT